MDAGKSADEEASCDGGSGPNEKLSGGQQEMESSPTKVEETQDSSSPSLPNDPPSFKPTASETGSTMDAESAVIKTGKSLIGLTKSIMTPSMQSEGVSLTFCQLR